MANYASAVIAIALNEVGYLEKKSNSQLDSKTANAGSNNYTKYGRDMHQIYPSVMDFPAFWCDSYTDWCFYKAYGVANAKGLLGGNFDDYTVASAQLYKNKGAYYKSNPKVGDQIFFNNGKRICHTGLVYAVDASKVYTVEGNTSGGSTVIANGGSVAKKSYALNYKRIDGYGRPKYDVETSTTPTTPSSPTVANQTAIIKAVQTWLKAYTSVAISISGQVDTNTKKVANKALQKALNEFIVCYNNASKVDLKLLTVDGAIGTSSKAMITKFGTIRAGSTGNLVKVFESFLYLRGYNPAEYSGQFNDSVDTVAKQFQKDNGLVQDGIIGSSSWGKLIY